MDRGDFERQISGFNKNDSEILVRAQQTVANFNSDPKAFRDTVADTPSPEHLWNLAICAINANNVNVATALSTVAQSLMPITAEKYHTVTYSFTADRAKNDLENYGHVVDLLDSFLSGEDTYTESQIA